jgi:hypothetical protein
MQGKKVRNLLKKLVVNIDKKIYEAAYHRSNGLCEICGSNDRVTLHHIIYGNGKRTEYESLEGAIFLCYEHHQGVRGVHGRDGHPFSLQLKLNLQQRYFDEGFTEDEVRVKMGGKLYDRDNQNNCNRER